VVNRQGSEAGQDAEREAQGLLRMALFAEATAKLSGGHPAAWSAKTWAHCLLRRAAREKEWPLIYKARICEQRCCWLPGDCSQTTMSKGALKQSGVALLT
jgi:hypothetical protein